MNALKAASENPVSDITELVIVFSREYLRSPERADDRTHHPTPQWSERGFLLASRTYRAVLCFEVKLLDRHELSGLADGAFHLKLD